MIPSKQRMQEKPKFVEKARFFSLIRHDSAFVIFLSLLFSVRSRNKS